MRLLIQLLFLFIGMGHIMSQDTVTFNIKSSLFNLGKLTVTKTQYPNADSTKYKLESSFKIWSVYSIYYSMESVFDNHVLLRTKSQIKVNEKMHHFCTTQNTDTGYIVENLNGASVFYKGAIKHSITPFYFQNYSGPDSIYSEFSGQYRPFIKKNDSTYILDPENPLEFVFNMKQITKVIVPNTIMDFYIELAK